MASSQTRIAAGAQCLTIRRMPFGPDGPLALLAIYGAVCLLHVVLPARTVEGYVRDAAGGRLRYRLNGLRVFAFAIAGYAALATNDFIPWDFIYRERFAMLATAFVLGLLFTCAIVLPAPPTGKGLLADLYLGRLPNPQALAGRVDAKMLLYLLGAVMLELCVLSFGAHHLLAHPGDPSPGVLLHVGLFTFFLVDYLVFERVHLYTYDFVAERVGFKLGWGCLVFYPFFYCIGLWDVADRGNPHPHPALLAASVALFFSGWVLARGANLQKYYFKTDPARATFGPIPQRALVLGDRRVLVSGFWGLSRHVNYLGELLMATALALCLGYPTALLPWLYPIYYVLLLVPRQLDDDRRCAEQYGPLWDEYRRAVPHRIIPFLY
jgi:Ergosterol biosynthesis ERG4/ERG24 family